MNGVYFMSDNDCMIKYMHRGNGVGNGWHGKGVIAVFDIKDTWVVLNFGVVTG